MTGIEDPRFFWNEDFGELFFAIRERAYELLPHVSDDQDIAQAVATAFEEREAGGPIDWALVRVVAPHWINPDNIFTLTDSLAYLPEGFQQKISELPDGEPTDVGPFREVLSALVIAQLNCELDQAEDEDMESEDA